MERDSFRRALRFVAITLVIAALVGATTSCSFLADRQAKKYLQTFGWKLQGPVMKTGVTVPSIQLGTLEDAYSYLLADMGDQQPQGGLAALTGSKVTQYTLELTNAADLPTSPLRGFGIVWMQKSKVVAAWTAAPSGVVPLDALHSDLFSVKGRLLEDVIGTTGLDTLSWLQARKALSSSGTGTPETVTYLANGRTKTTDRQVLEAFEMLRSQTDRLPFAWGKIPMYVARYYTADLTGAAGLSVGRWDDILAGSGLNVRINGNTVATYVGGNPGVSSVPLVFADGRKGYFVELSPLGQDGLLVVSKVNAATAVK